MQKLLIILTFIPVFSGAQPCTLYPGMTPATAIPVCGTSIFTQNSTQNCTGIADIPHIGCTNQVVTSNSSYWYKIHCFQSGNLGFTITPFVASDDFDWELFDISSATDPNAVFASATYELSLNIYYSNSSTNTVTGCTPGGNNNVNCGPSYPNSSPFNFMPFLSAGGNYLLMVTNWSQSGNGYSLAFTGGTAVITDPALPGVDHVDNGCNMSQLNVYFTKDIRCNSVTPTGSEFTIMPGNIPATAVLSPCTQSFYTINQLTLTTATALSPGNYTLLVSNGTDGNTFKDVCDNELPAGTQIPFTINAQAPGMISNVMSAVCSSNELTVTLSKPVLCTSITANGSEFAIVPGNPVITGVQSTDCVRSTSTNTLKITLQNPLPYNNYQLLLHNGTDGNTFIDTCGLTMLPSAYAFTIAQPPAPVFDSVSFDKCSPGAIKAWYSQPVNCSSISADGSDFLITGPMPVTIISATTAATCASGYSPWVMLNFAQPVNGSGNFVLHNLTGSDGNGIIDTCAGAQDPAETISFTTLDKPSAAFTNIVNWGCDFDSIHFVHPGGNGINAWKWTFSDNTTASGQQVSHIFPASTAAAVAVLVVNNGQCSDTATATVPLDNSFKAAFTLQPADTVCIGNNVSFNNISTGNNLVYSWEFGDNSGFSGLTPPAHLYSVPNNYLVKLVAVNNHQCRDTASKMITISGFPVVDFTGLHTQYCNAEPVILKAVLQGNFSNYTWDNGDGKTIQNQPVVNFKYSNEGVFSIKLSADDRYCGNLVKSKSTAVYKTPVFDLGNDTSLCSNTSIIIGISNAGQYPLLWNTGETTPRISTRQVSEIYKLKVNNNGCEGVDSIRVLIRSNCLIKVPDAFTPNGDGLNDELKAINADFDLTRQFAFAVYNRFGQRVFYSNNPTEGWDGKCRGLQQQTGAYIWELKYTDRLNGKPVFEKGSSLLIR